ncbi:MAG: protease inhibitor I42 family protein [Victivallales bacterium]|nr:protease inhibitor I42 family protein [Victivallales bacterium]
MTARSNLIALTAGVVLLSFGHFGCIAANQVETTPEITDRQKTIILKAGATTELELPENPTTGYLWQYDNSAPATCRVEDDRFIPSTSPLVGAPGTRCWKLVAVKPGRAVLSFRYVRSWEKDREPARRYTAVIVVKSQ